MPTASQPMAAIFFEPGAAALGEHDVGHAAALGLAGQRVDHLGHVAQGKLFVLRRRQHAAPGIEQHHRLRAGGNLRIQIQDGGLGEHFEQSMQIARRLVHHALDLAEGLAAAAFHHVGRHRPRAAREADERHSAVQVRGAPAPRHRSRTSVPVPDPARRAWRYPPRCAPGARTSGPRRPRTPAPNSSHAESSGCPRTEWRRPGDSGRPAASVISQAISGLVHMARKSAGARARRAVFRQIAARLAHQPNRPARRRLPQQGAQQQVVLQDRAHAGAHVRSPGSNSRRCSRMA